MKETCLITGGLGYLGGRISKFLIEKSEFPLRIGTHQPHRTLPTWFKGCEMAPMNLEGGESLDEACQGVEAIIHLAALNEIESADNPERALIVNSIGTLKLLKAALKAKVGRFIYFSTAHVYGSPLTGTLTEKTLPRPIHPYAISHRCAEDWVMSAHRQKSIEGVVIRLSNGFGPPATLDADRWTLIVNDLCRQAATTGKLILRSAGLQRRDFIPLSDVCRAVLHLLELSSSQLGDGLFNLGREASIPIRELAERIAQRCQKVLGNKPEIECPPPSSHDQNLPLDYRMDKLKATGFSLTGDFDLEIDETLRFCRKSFPNFS